MKLNLVAWISLLLVCSCKKEHLEPENPPGNTQPLAIISAKLDSDSVYFAAGINGYQGIPSYTDTNNNRTFDFKLINEQTSLSYFMVAINNYKTGLGDPQSDLDSTVFPGNLNYNNGIFGFVPLAVTIIWVDESGNQYKSTSLIPNNFIITETEDIIYDSKKYKKAVIRFECFLQYTNNNLTDTIHLTGGEATLLFSIS